MISHEDDVPPAQSGSATASATPAQTVHYTWTGTYTDGTIWTYRLRPPSSGSTTNDTATRLNINSTFLDEFIAFFGDRLLERSGARRWADYTLATQPQEHIEMRLNLLLEGYTAKLASNLWIFEGSDISEKDYEMLVGAAYLIRRHQLQIIRYFSENVTSTPANALALSERLKNLGQRLSPSEGFVFLAKSEPRNLELEETVQNLNAEHQAVDDDDVNLVADLGSICDMLMSGDAFDRLALEVRRMMPYPDDMCEMDNIGCYRKRQSSDHIREYTVHWDVMKCMRSRYGDKFPRIGSVIVLTGSALYAQATTCEKYIRQTWPKTGMILVEALDLFMDNMSTSHGGANNVSNKDDKKIIIASNTPGHFKVSIERGDDLFVTEIAQQLAWLGSALSISPFGDQVAYAKPVLTLVSFIREIDIKFKHERLHPTERACWLPLFSGAVIASGFPIPSRANEIGLEIAVELLAGLSGVQHAVEFQGGVVMKGFSHLFVPVRKTSDRIQWHAVSSANLDTHLTYHEGLSQCGSRAMLDEVSLDDLRTCRTIVGWCSVAQSRLGSSSVNYGNIHYSTATDTKSSVKCAGASLGFQHFGVAALDFEFGVTEGKCHFKRDGPYRNIVTWAEKTPVVLYDTSERRGWLVPASEVVLHIIQCRHRLEPFEVGGKRITLDTEVAINSSAKEVLLRNMSVRLSDDDEHTFKTEIASVWSLLDFLIAENVAREHNPSGYTIKSTWGHVLHGFEFNAAVEQHSPFRQKQTKLFDTSGGWPLLSRDIDALVLLANGFEDVIVPAVERSNNHLCRSWKWVPKGKDFLSTRTPMLRKLYERAGCPLDRKFLTSSGTKLQWHQGSSLLFDPCAESNLAQCQCNRLQQIVSKSTVTRIVPPDNIVDQGAVIFGHSGSIVADKLTKLRVPAPKIAGIYSQENMQLPPIVTQQDSEDSSFSDEDIFGQNNSDTTMASVPSSLSSATTFSTQGTPVTPLTPLSRKQQRLPGAHVLRADEEYQEKEVNNAVYLDTGYKRFKSVKVQNAPHLSFADCHGGHLERNRNLCQSQSDYRKPSKESTESDKRLPYSSGDQGSAFLQLDGENDRVSKRSPGTTRLAVRIPEPKSQYNLRCLYQEAPPLKAASE